MENMYCYKCGKVQDFEKEEPRYDYDQNGKIEITDITCATCKKRVRLYKRVG